MSRLIRSFTVCLVNLFFYSNILNMKQTRLLSEFSRLSEYTRVNPIYGLMIHRMFTDEPAHSHSLIIDFKARTNESQRNVTSNFHNQRMYPQSSQLACQKYR